MPKKCKVCGKEIGSNSKSFLCKEHGKKEYQKKYYKRNWKAEHPYAFRVVHVKGESKAKLSRKKKND